MSDAKPLTLYERETNFFQDTDCLLKICRHVASGGSVIDLADLHGIRYCDIMAFIRSTKASSDLYDKALLDRNEWAKERVLKELHDVVDKQADLTPEGIQTKAQVRDRLKAVELIGKTQALFTDRVERTTTLKLEDLVLASYKDEKDSVK
jgi:hypothetical protein